MRVDVVPRQADITPGQQLMLTVTITNTASVIGGYALRVLGADPGWVSLETEQISLFPDEVRVVPLAITPPAGLPAGVRRIAVQVRELTPPEDSSIADIDLTVPAAKSMQVRVDPVAVTAGKRAVFSVIAENTGNTTIAGRFAGDDPENKVGFLFDPEIVSLAPGEHAVVDMRAQAKRHLSGSPAVRMLGVYLDETRSDDFFGDPEAATEPARGDQAAVATATFIQKPVLSRGAFSLMGLLAAITVFAFIITLALGRLVGQSTADRDLALQVAAARNGGSAGGTSGLGGTAHLLTTGMPLSAVSVSVYDAADTARPIVTTATDQEGRYQVSQLAAGKYKVAFRRAGYVATWYPAATSDADASEVEVKPGEQKQGLDVSLGGLPASISGTVVGDDVSASMLYLETVPGSSGAATTGTNADSSAPLDPSAPAPNPLTGGSAIVQKLPVGADGTFALTDVPSPNVYQLVVVKTGYATTTQRLDVAGGENRTGVELTLRKGDGLISGTVSDASGPLANVTITATSGQTTVTTVSLTDAARRGQFTLRGLPTPSSFTVTATVADHAAQTLSLTLASGQQLEGVQISLGSSSGALNGDVTEMVHTAVPGAPPTDEPAGGVTVTATDGLLTVQSQTQSRGNVGHWHIGGLPVPGVYTLTFTRTDLTSQTVSVSMDANGTVAGGPVHVSMQSATTDVSGRVSQDCGTDETGAPIQCRKPWIGEATVTLNSGSQSYTVTTASTPAADRGKYAIGNLPPGTYTLTVSAGSGVSTTSKVITLIAGEPYIADVTLNVPASLGGTLQAVDAKGNVTGPLSGWTVFLYPSDQYPTTVTKTVMTDPTGAFRFPAIDAGDYVVAVGPTSDAGSAVQTQRVTVQPSTAGQLTIKVTR